MSGASDFWTRRRAAVEVEEARAEAQAQSALLAEDHAKLEDRDDAEILAELDLPDPDTLKAGDDFSVFMAKVVPDRIRRRALRKLWLSNPVLANVDELVDYGQDFTDNAMVMEGMQTAYQVGKGMLKHVEELTRQAAEKEAPQEPTPPEVETEEQPDPMMARHEDVTPHVLVPEDAEDNELAAAPAQRRMQFEYEAQSA